VEIERRKYQELIISEILKGKREGRNLIIELDAGMGKRIVSYLLTKTLPREERILIITPSQASLRDTYSTFQTLYKRSGMNVDEIGYISAGVPAQVKRKLLETKRVIIATPISLVNVLRKNPTLLRDFSIILINEVDKAVRRAAEVEEEGEEIRISTAKELSKVKRKVVKRVRLTYPWNELKKFFPPNACIIGMSGTLRDKHIVRDISGEVVFMPELETLMDALFPKEKPLNIITMDYLIQRTDADRYIIRNITIIRKIPVEDERIEKIVNAISEEIERTGERIITKYGKMFTEKNIEKLERGLPLIPDTDFLKIKYLRLALVRRFVLASIPEHYRRFLKRKSIKNLLEKKTGEKLDDLIPEKSSKVEKILEIARNWIELGKKVTILTSFIRVAEKLKRELEKLGLRVFLITGKTLYKGKILSEFKSSKDPAVLVMTPVGERDIDLSDVELIIVHDVISTVKTMYQRFKRGRRCFVSVLYYKNTFEEKKVNKLLDRMKKYYPWSLKVEN